MSIKMKLAAAFCLVLAALGALAYFCLSGLNDNQAIVEEITQESSVFEALAKDIKISMLEHRRYEKDFFITTNNAAKQAEYREDLIEESERMQERLAQLASMAADNPAVGPEQRQMIASLAERYNEYMTGLLDVMAQMEGNAYISSQSANVMMAPFKDTIVSLEQDIDAIAELGRSMVHDSADRARQSTAKIRKTMLTVMISALAAILLLGLYLFTAIVRPLARGEKFAAAVANGDLNASLDVSAKDEVGRMLAAVALIPANLKSVMQAFQSVVDEIKLGRLSTRGDSSKFSGAYAELLENGNALTDSLMYFIDNTPAPIMGIDAQYNILYLNKAGLGLLGGDQSKVYGKKCHDFFKTGDCKTEQCACAQAMKKLVKSSSSTHAHPLGVDLEINYIGIPILDKKGKPAGAFEIIIDQTDIVRAQQRMSHVASQAVEISERMSSAAEELSAQVDESSRGAVQQKMRAEETATAMEQMNSTVMEVARNAGDASSSADEARSEAEAGAEVVSRAIDAIARVEERAHRLKTDMEDLGQKAEGIGRILGVISDIADQTNLLALNAAIEAARAGEAGRGFAVVADEVRKLAEKTMAATGEVGGAVAAIQEVAERNMASVDQAVQAVEESTALARESGEMLRKIVAMVENSSDQVRTIATAAEEQSAATEQISRSTEEINRISTDTAEGMTQSAQAITELAQLAQQLNTLISELNG